VLLRAQMIGGKPDNLIRRTQYYADISVAIRDPPLRQHLRTDRQVCRKR
jgi:hypothetical protein